MPNILDPGVRYQIIQEIEGDENKRRKAESLKRFEVYNDRQRPYVIDMLTKEFGASSVLDMRTCTSVNLTNRIVNEMASIYSRPPERIFENATEREVEQLEALYKALAADVKLKWSNRKFKLHDQCALQVIPKNGEICARVLAPHHYDAIPYDDDPETAYAYIISSYDKNQAITGVSGGKDVQGSGMDSKNASPSDGRNQKIADQDDYKTQKKYVWWSAENNFITDENGMILGDDGVNENPIGILPFIDISLEKDFEYWVRKGSGIVDFNLDFSTVLSDTCNTSRLQSYAQAVISSAEHPQNITVGPNNLLWLQLDKSNPEVRPAFEFASPSPDMAASLELLDRLLRYFLSSKGIDPKTISGTISADKFSSGVERLLAMIDKFEASQDDIDLFRAVEEKLFELIKAWSNALQGTDALRSELKLAQISDAVKLAVAFNKPEMVQTKAEAEDSVIKQLDAGLISKIEAIETLRGVSREEAERIVLEIEPKELEPVSNSVTQFDNNAMGDDNARR